MALPRPVRPEYSTTIPSTGKKIKYQPFSVREEKVLVLAAESGEEEEITSAVVNTLKRCIVSPADIDIGSLALFDIEYLFLKARAKSVGEKIEVMVTDPDDQTFSMSHEIFIDKIGVKRTDGHTDLIDVDDNIKLQMKYPDISFFTEGVDVNSMSGGIETIARCIKALIIDDEEVINREDMTDEEINEWLEGLTTSQFRKVTKFFETMPKLEHSFTLKNTNTGKDFEVRLEGLADFF